MTDQDVFSSHEESKKEALLEQNEDTLSVTQQRAFDKAPQLMGASGCACGGSGGGIACQPSSLLGSIASRLPDNALVDALVFVPSAHEDADFAEYSAPAGEFFSSAKDAVSTVFSPDESGDMPADVSADVLTDESGDMPADVSADVLTDESGESGGRSLALVFGIRLRKTGQVFFFHNGGFSARAGSKVLVDVEQGQALGEVVSILDEIATSSLEGEHLHGTVSGLATAQDIALHAENSILAAEAAAFCKTCIRQRELDMKLVDVEVLHDRSKIIFFFTAPARIDFRELVKDLVRNYRTRIELRQIGVRHETQMVGGLGNCGMVCCCHKYLRKFAPVTIKMAKEQNLFFNPAKLSGMCGRLLCCLSFEQSNYEEFNRLCPKLGKKYTTTRGNIKVLRANMFSQTVSCLSESNEELEFTLDEWEALQPQRAEPLSPEQQRAAQKVPAKEGGLRKGKDRGALQGRIFGQSRITDEEGATQEAAPQRPHQQRPRKRGRQELDAEHGEPGYEPEE